MSLAGLVVGVAAVAGFLGNVKTIHDAVCELSKICDSASESARMTQLESEAWALGRDVTLASLYSSGDVKLGRDADASTTRQIGLVSDRLKSLKVAIDPAHLNFSASGLWDFRSFPDSVFWFDSDAFRTISHELRILYGDGVRQNFEWGAWVTGCDVKAESLRVSIADRLKWHTAILARPFHAVELRPGEIQLQRRAYGTCPMPNELKNETNS
jgi:hypothetical protein